MSLDLSEQNLTSLPENLPSGLTELDCDGNNLTSLPENLPSGLTELDCDGNNLTSLPENLPSALTILDCRGNNLVSLPENLPSGLITLYCGGNKLTYLPKIPEKCCVYGNNNRWIWCARIRDAKKIGLSKNKVIKIYMIVCKYYARRLATKIIKRNLERWLDAPVTNDGKLGIRLRIGMREHCGHTSLYPPS